MKVVLLQKIKGFGEKFDIKEVKSGYARNFLIPQRLVRVATPKIIKELESQKAAWEKEKKEKTVQLEAAIKNLLRQELIVELKVGKKGEVFSSVNEDEIKQRVISVLSPTLKLGKEDLSLNLKRPIREIGEYQIEVDFGGGVKAEIKITAKAE